MDKFSPNQYVISLKGKAYLPAMPRVAWMRSEHPEWTIDTEVSKFMPEEGFVIVRARVLDETGRLVASAVKSQSKGKFDDYIEKAETGAISRALALCGYGTMMAADIEEDGAEKMEERNGKVIEESTDLSKVLSLSVKRDPSIPF